LLFDGNAKFERSFPAIGLLTLDHYDVIITRHGRRNLAATIARHVRIIDILTGRVGDKNGNAVRANLLSV